MFGISGTYLSIMILPECWPCVYKLKTYHEGVKGAFVEDPIYVCLLWNSKMNVFGNVAINELQ